MLAGVAAITSWPRAQKQAQKSVLLLRPALQLTGPRTAGLWALGSGLLPPRWGKSLVGRVIDMVNVGKTERSGFLAGRSRAPAWANVRNVRRCNVRPQGVSKPDSRVSISPSRLSPFFLLFFTGCRGSHSCTSVLWSFSCQLRQLAFSFRHDFSGSPAFMTRVSDFPGLPGRPIPSPTPTSHEPCARTLTDLSVA